MPLKQEQPAYAYMCKGVCVCGGGVIPQHRQSFSG